MNYPIYIKSNYKSFNSGFNYIINLTDKEPSLMGLSVLKLAAGTKLEKVFSNEMAWLLMKGKYAIEYNSFYYVAERHSLFDDQPIVFHGGKGQKINITAQTDLEFTIYESLNQAELKALWVDGKALKDELRGKGTMNDTATRIVRTMLEPQTTMVDPSAKLVLGEVVTLPGKWSSYPPHNHPQPEIYHYRISNPELGYAFGEAGGEAFKIRHGDTIRILNSSLHTQAAAPGFAVYYSWCIHHLENNKYIGPKWPNWLPEYEYLRDSKTIIWQPK